MRPPLKKSSLLYRPQDKPRRRSLLPRRASLTKDFYADGEQPRAKLVKRVIGGIAVVLLLQALFQLPFLRLQVIEINGLRYVPDTQVRDIVTSELHRRRFIIFKNDNFFIFSSTTLRKRLDAELQLDIQSIKRRFPNHLALTVKERVAAFVLQTPEHYVALDNAGNSTTPVPGPSGNQMVIADERATKEAALPGGYLEKITHIKDQWASSVTTVGIARFNLTDDAHIIVLTTDKKYKIYFNPDKDLDKQLERLAVYVAEGAAVSPGEYLDLRFENLYIK